MSESLAVSGAVKALVAGLDMSVAMSGMETTGEGRTGSIENAILIAGPTASGKSRLALELAQKTKGVIVNADSMQVYDVLNALTARPSASDLGRAPHLLYGHVDPAVAYSTGAWLRDVQRLSQKGAFANRRPIFVGGTGLYFRALVNGLSRMPDIPPDIRDRWRYRLNEEGAPRLHRTLMQVDPAVAMRLQAGDGQRIVRALEVLEASGRSILEWQAATSIPMIDARSATLKIVDIDRQILSQRIGERLRTMIASGALDEVRALHRRRLDPALPAMRAIGVSDLVSVIEGALPLEQALERIAALTRQYAKRQATWFRHQLGPEWQRIPADSLQSADLI